MKLTLRVLEGLTCPAGKKDRLVSDDDQRGLYVRVTSKAKAGSLDGMNFLAKPPTYGKIPLGPCSAIAIAKARQTAPSWAMWPGA